MKCQKCLAQIMTYYWFTFSNRTCHIRVDCSKCGSFVKWAPQTEVNVALAGQPPPGWILDPDPRTDADILAVLDNEEARKQN